MKYAAYVLPWLSCLATIAIMLGLLMLFVWRVSSDYRRWPQ